MAQISHLQPWFDMDVDAVVFTGGMACDEAFCNEIAQYTGGKFRILRLPGEEEMRSLAEGALHILHGEPAKVY